MTTVAADTFDGATEEEARGIVLIGEEAGPAFEESAVLSIPGGSGQAGIVFGYKSGANYWMSVRDAGSGTSKVYHVVDGAKTLVINGATTPQLSLGTAFRNSMHYPNAANLPDGYPSGKHGLYSSVSGAQFDMLSIRPESTPTDMAGRWQTNRRDAIVSSTLQINAESTGYGLFPTLLKGPYLQKFEATFSMDRVTSGTSSVGYFVFGASDREDYNYLLLYHRGSQEAPDAFKVVDGKATQAVTATRTNANAPSPGSTKTLWVRVSSNGTTVTVKQIATTIGDPAPSEGDWTGTNVCLTTNNFPMRGGLIGFAGSNQGYVKFDNLTLKSWNPSTSAFDVTEAAEAFTLDGSGYAEQGPSYDAAGNLTYDGVNVYTYDAWNRLTKVAHGYRDSGGTLHSGQTYNTIRYDGKGRRIIKTISNSGHLDCTYHYYLDRDSVIEERNGSDQTIKQHVWGMHYIDELIQTAVNKDYTSDDDCLEAGDDQYWVCQDANYNVLGIVDKTGILKERYEYSPCGQRTVYFSPGANDTGLYSPTQSSRRVLISTVTQAWGVCEFGHQGLQHDEDSNLIYNRARMLSPTLGRFLQRDPAGYVDGLSLYGYAASNPIILADPYGYDSDDATDRDGVLRYLRALEYVSPQRPYGDGKTFDTPFSSMKEALSHFEKDATRDGISREQAETQAARFTGKTDWECSFIKILNNQAFGHGFFGKPVRTIIISVVRDGSGGNMGNPLGHTEAIMTGMKKVAKRWKATLNDEPIDSWDFYEKWNCTRCNDFATESRIETLFRGNRYVAEESKLRYEWYNQGYMWVRAAADDLPN